MLSDQLVILRPFRAEDTDRVFVAARESLQEVGQWLPWCHHDYARNETANWIGLQSEAWKNGTEYNFAVFDRASGQFVGSCGLNQIDRAMRKANLGYWVRTSAAGRGFATAATRLAADFAFEQLELERIEIVAALDNKASQRVALKAGAVREGIARKRLRVYDVQHDAVVFSMIRQEAT